MSETSNTTPSSTPAGWYPHPGAEGAPGSEMYWDGTTWRTDLVRQPGATDAAVPAHATVTSNSGTGSAVGAIPSVKPRVITTARPRIRTRSSRWDA